MLKDTGMEFIYPDLKEFREAPGIQKMWNDLIAALPVARSVIDNILAAK